MTPFPSKAASSNAVKVYSAVFNFRVILLISAFAFAIFSAHAQLLTARPDRGFGGQGGYQATDIDSISLQNGSLNLQIPLASLPPVAGGKLSYTLYAHYNSKLWNARRGEALGTTDTPGCQPTYSTQELVTADRGAGWEIGGQYEIFFRDAHDDYDYLSPDSEECYGYEFYYMQGRFFKPMLRMPDGSEHEMRIDGSFPAYTGTRDHLKGYYEQSGGYPGYPTFTSPVRMYTIDGTYITAVVNPPSYSIYSTIYLKDGTRIENSADGQRTKDTNGNSILNGIRVVNGSNEWFAKDEQTGREIKWNNNSVQYQTVGGTWQAVTINWGTTTVQGKVYPVTTWCSGYGELGGSGSAGYIHQPLEDTPFSVIREIIFPQTETGVDPPKYSFAYNSDNTVQATFANPRWTCPTGQTFPDYTRTVSVGWGELSDVTIPSGSHIKYNYSNDGKHEFAFLSDQEIDEVLKDTVGSKAVTHDGTTETWTYNITNYSSNMVSGGSVTGPDGATHSELYNPTNIAYSNFGSSAGMLVKSNESNRVLTERHWTALGGTTTAIGSPEGVNINQVVDTEYTTLLADDGITRLKINAKKFFYDYNGELTQTIDYDWFDPSTVTYTNPGNYLSMPAAVPASATVLRVTNNTYYNQAANSSSSNAYQKRTVGASTVILGMPEETTIGNGSTVKSTTRFSYDSQAYGLVPIKGNLTKVSAWDDAAVQWVESQTGYDSYGNVTSKTDPKGNMTQIAYGDATHAMPTSTTVDPQNGTGLQTTSATYDYYTGLPLTSTDVNGNVSSVDYTNNLLGTVDPFGRPGTSYGPFINISGVNKRQTVKTYYEDNARRTRVESDLFNEGDALLKARTTRDQLGRTVLSEKNENGASNYTILSQTVYDTPNRVVMTSNPMRSGAASTDGWTRATSDILGRPVEVTTFSGASQPPSTGTNTNWTGSVTTAYASNATTVTDQAGKLRRSITNALGQLTRVDEPDNAGQLGTVTSPNQYTSYTYDVLGNLTTVTQSVQTRTFTYSSLSRLLTAANPESGTISYAYDANGNLTGKTDARSVATTYAYDALNRVTSRSYSDGTPTVTYAYDNLPNAKGKLTKVSSSVSTTEYTSFDTMGRVLAHKQTTDGTAYTTGYTYNLSGALTEETYPSGRKVRNTLNTNGDLSLVETQPSGGSYATRANNFTYTAAGAVSSMQLGNGRWESTQFNSRLQPTQIALGTTQNGTDQLKLNYDYGTTANNGNVQSQTITVPGMAYPLIQTYTYDTLNRLKSAEEKSNGTTTWKQTFLYDRYGNRNFDTANTTTLGSCSQQQCNPTISATNNRFTSGQGYTYDLSGNVVTDAEGRTFTFDAENKQTLVKDGNNATIGQYYYDGDGKRVKKAATTENIVFVYDAAGKLVEEYSGSTLQTAYVYAGSRLLTTETSAGINYLTSDHLGSPRINTNATGIVTARHDYMPFGEEIFTVGGRTSGLGYNTDSIRKKFTGYERDSETDLDYAKARMFGNPIGRFTSPDLLLSSGRIENPQTWNRYIYVLNNPLALTDPTGLWEWGEEAGGSATDEELKATSKDKTLSKDARKKASKALEFRKNFKAALALASAAATSNKLTQKQREAISRAVNSYGTEGDGNNVIVSFANQGSGIGANTDGTLGDLVFVSFRFEKKGKDLALDIAHEGSHVADNQDFDLVASLGMCGANSANITLLDSERRAYGVTSFAAQALGVSPVFDYPNETKYYIWNSGWKEADRDRKRSAGIENLLRDKSPYAGSIFYQNRFSDIEKDR